MNDIDDDLLRAWLLHRPVDERIAATLEERVLADDAFGIRLQAIETDLIDDHARGLLDEDDRRAVACWLLGTPADRARLRNAVALASALGAIPPARAQETASGAQRTRRAVPDSRTRRPQRRVVFALATAAAVLLAVFAFWQRSGYVPSSNELAAHAQTITLLASRQRGSQRGPDATISIAHTTSAARLQVEIMEGDATTRYTLRIADATRSVFEARNLKAKTVGPYRFVEATLAPGTLREGEFQIRVGVEDPPRMLQEWTVQAHAN